MSKLLWAYLARLRKDKPFWLALILAFGVAVYQCVNNTLTYGGFIDYKVVYEANLSAVLLVGLSIAVVGSLFLGTEYSDGTLRNQIIAGHSKASVYLSGFMTCVITGLLLLLAYWLVIVGWVFLLHLTVQSPELVLLAALNCCAMILAFSGLTALVVMNSSHKAVNIVAIVLVTMVLCSLAQSLDIRLKQDEFLYSYVYSYDRGLFQETRTETAPNRLYIGGAKRTAYELICDILPAGQAFHMLHNGFGRDSTQTAQQFAVWYACSVADAAVTTAVGIAIFRKKDLK